MDKGLEDAGLGETVVQVEADEWCRRVLAKHWPSARRFDDVSTFGRGSVPELSGRVVLCGGFPCQDLSSAGKQAGIHEGKKSGLWREFFRVATELLPEAIVIENVSSGQRGWVPFVRRDLHLLGYDTTALAISAADVGAPHERRRVFILAYHRSLERPGRARALVDASDADGDRAERVSGGRAGAVRGQGEGEPGDDGGERCALGLAGTDAVCARREERVRVAARSPLSRPGDDGGDGAVADADGLRRRGRASSRRRELRTASRLGN